jgi:hypothetical protein
VTVNHKWVAAVGILLVLSGCGGSGGGGSNPPAPPVTPGLQQVSITRENAAILMNTSFNLMDLSRSVIYDFPYLANYVMYYAENGQYYEETACDNAGGTATVNGDLSEYDGTGEIVFTDHNCVDSQNDIRTDGIIRIIIDQTDYISFPIIYTISFEDYEAASAAGAHATVADGTIQIYSPSGVGQRVTSDLRLTDVDSGVYIESDGLTIRSDIAVGDYPYVEDTRISGTVGRSDYGTVDLSSGTSITDYMKMAGTRNTGVQIEFLDEDKFIASLDNDGDGSPNAYMSATVSELSKDPGMNDAPVAVIEDTIEVEQGDPMIVSLHGVTDPDCDFLDYSIDLVESPPGSQFDWSIDDNLNLVIHADRGGNYIFELIVNDGNNETLLLQIKLHIMQDLPEVELEHTSFQYASGDQVEIDLSPSNLDQGPFTYGLSPSIAGMTINDDGILEWRVPTLEYFPQASMVTTVSVKNASHEVEISLSFTITDSAIKHPNVRTGIRLPNKERNIHVGDFDNDGTTEILLTDNINLIYSLEWKNSEYVQDWVYPYEINSSNVSIDAILPLDPDGDGLYSIYVQTGKQIKILNNNVVTATLDLPPFLEVGAVRRGWGIAAADLDNNGSIELVALYETESNDSVAYIMDAASLDLIWQTPFLDLGKGFDVGNVDNDSALEIVFSGGFVYDGISHESDWTYQDEFGSNIVLADIDGNGVDEIVAARVGRAPIVYDAVSMSALFEITGENDVCSITTTNLDNDSAEEIITGHCQPWGNVSAYNADSSFASVIWSISPQDYGTESLAVGDSDQDGNDEVLWGTGLSSSGEDYLVVFDPINREIDFMNADPSQLTSPFIGGRSITNSNGESRVVFAVEQTDDGYNGSRFITMDFDANDVTVSPEVGSNRFRYFDFCIADYDLDDTEEVLFSSSEIYDGFLSAYDLYNMTEEWFVPGDYTTAGDVACGDVNSDGHTDLATIWELSIHLYDPFNQSLLWSSAQLPSKPERIEIHDLNGDGVPEILALHQSVLVVYTWNGSIYTESTAYSDSNGYMNDIFVEDLDGDQEPEIVISIIEDSYYSEGSYITVLNKDLSIRNFFSIDGKITAMTAIGRKDDTLLVATTSERFHVRGPKSYVRLFDLQAADIVWSSPPLLGEVTGQSLHVVQEPGASKEQLAIGAYDAMYITQ